MAIALYSLRLRLASLRRMPSYFRPFIFYKKILVRGHQICPERRLFPGLSKLFNIVLRADIKPIVDGEAAHRAASPSISVLTYLRIAISMKGMSRCQSI